jgi:hypothetical protein
MSIKQDLLCCCCSNSGLFASLVPVDATNTLREPGGHKNFFPERGHCQLLLQPLALSWMSMLLPVHERKGHDAPLKEQVVQSDVLKTIEATV